MSRRPIIGPAKLVSLCLAALALALAACSSGGSGGSGTTSSLTSMSTGYLPIAGYVPYNVASDQGIWKKNGLDVSLVQISSPAVALDDVVSGKLDIGQVSVGAAAVALEQKLPITIIAAGYYDYATQGIYVPANSPIKSVSDLAGKTIALGGLDNNFQACIDAALAAAGVNPSSVKYTLVSIGDTASTLLAGKVDAAQIQEPYITQEGSAIRALIPHPWNPLGAGQPHIVSYIITSKSYAASHPQAVKSYVAAWNEALQFSQANPSVTRAATAKITGLLTALANKITLPEFNTSMDLAGAQDQLSLMLKYKILTSEPSLANAYLYEHSS